ncbi:MAG: isocitrate lyase, partial [Chakrabartia godavariana]
MSYQQHIQTIESLKAAKGGTWDGINPESVARMRLQNQFRTGLDIARYTAKIMREDMAAYDADPANYTQSLGCWHGFIAQQKMISIKKHFGTTKRKYLYLSGWMVAALRSEFGPLPDQSMHEKTSVPALIEELYTFLRQADSRELNLLFRDLDAARAKGDAAKEAEIQSKIDNFETHIVPIIADIDAGFGNAEATYLLAKKMIEAGACALQIENQVSDEKQCGHQDGKVTVPHEDFIAKVRACRYAFLELGVEDGIIVTRTDSLGAGLTKQIAVSHEPGDIGDQYNSFLDCEEIDPATAKNGDVILNRNGKLLKPKRLPSNLYQFRAGTGEDRCVLDCITSLQNGADLLWIETEKPHVGQIGGMVSRIREVIPNAKLVYNNSPSFNWTLNFRQQVFDAWTEAGKDVSAYDR